MQPQKHQVAMGWVIFFAGFVFLVVFEDRLLKLCFYLGVMLQMLHGSQNSRVLLGVNVDHIATIRQARLTSFPDPVMAAQLAEQAGADGITMHLREDRRHIQDADLFRAREVITTRLNFEMAATDEMIAIAKQVRPDYVCIVPEKREELTTEGGLNVFDNSSYLTSAIADIQASGVQVSLFVDPDNKALDQVAQIGANIVELHTGEYAEAKLGSIESDVQLARIAAAVNHGLSIGLQVNAGHGLNYHNTAGIASIAGVTELNIGHSIVSRALFSGWSEAVAEMKSIIAAACHFPRVQSSKGQLL